MKPIESTAEILAFKMLGRSAYKTWTDWAYDMLLAGFETENLVMLAGETEPFNSFEMERLTDKVLRELNLAWNDRELVWKNYIRYLINEVLSGKREAFNVLHILKEFYVQLDHKYELADFACLYWAKDDLVNYGEQSYWNDATKENIDEVIMAYFIDWKKNCDS